MATGDIRVPILAYHHIGEPPPGCADAATYLDPRRFARQIAFLRRFGYRAVAVADVARALLGHAPLPPRPVVLTFDDGWSDVHETAFALLRNAGFRATVFLVGEALGRDEIAHPESRQRIAASVMSVEQIRELADAGWEIGAHSNSHRHLTRLSEAEARDDIGAGRRAVERVLGLRPEVFAYPYGDFHGGLARAVEGAGFVAACSTVPGRVHRPAERFFLRRVPIARGASLLRFAHAISWRQYRKGETRLAARAKTTWEKETPGP